MKVVEKNELNIKSIFEFIDPNSNRFKDKWFKINVTIYTNNNNEIFCIIE